MPTFTALTTLNGQAAAEALGEDIERMTPAPTGVGTFEIEDGSGRWEVGAYFDDKPDEAALALLAAIHGANPFAVSELPEVDWVDKVRRELTPVEAGRFFVYGSHDADKVPEGAEALLIEASMAFGTGHHGTTQGCLLALDRLAREGMTGGRVLDLGCGTAVLAMAAARIWPGTVLASDIDAVAVEVARANVAANGLAGRVDCVEVGGLDHPQIAAAAPFDLIFANILKAPLIALAPDITDALAPGGQVILSGILNEQADEVIAVYKGAGNNLADRAEIGEWTTAVMQKLG
ncbi:50S ribosomal protein L11 methyltransferase [Roseovarius salis]|uniref:50S ribosomal protein L11 methyltransferase n=1 Tax=Roseovarius salis TaxID=3376063 RepID=UPI0037C60C9B